MQQGKNNKLSMMKKILIMLAVLMASVSAQAQVEEIGGFDFSKRKAEQEAEAKRAQEAAREAAEKAAEARKAAEEAEKLRLKTEEEQRIAQELGKKRKPAKEKTGKEKPNKVKPQKVRTHEDFVKDSLKWVAKQQKLQASQVKLEKWQTKWALGGQLAVNWLVADNVTDHPPFRYAGDAINVGINAYGAHFFNRVTGVRVGVGFHRMSNRVDVETVEEAWWHNWSKDPDNPRIIYEGNGYYNFNVFEVYGDGMFDVTGLKNVRYFRPFHLYAIAGLGLLAAGEKKLKGTMHEEMFERVVDEKTGRTRLKIGGDYCESFESRVDTIRLGLLMDYRIARNLSVNLELNMNVTTNDNLEGIKYAEPFDIPLRIAGGVMFRF